MQRSMNVHHRMVYIALPKIINPNPIYLTPLDDPVLVRDAIFYERPSPECLTKKEQVNPVDNHTLEPIEYCNQLPLIPNALEEFKQTKGSSVLVTSSQLWQEEKTPVPSSAKAGTLLQREPGMPVPQYGYIKNHNKTVKKRASMDTRTDE
ncbi:hypothetical protein Tco_0784069 [Tanacetum coccineum]